MEYPLPIVVSTLNEAYHMMKYVKHFQNFKLDILYGVPISLSKLPSCAEISNEIESFSVLIDSESALDILEQYSLKNPKDQPKGGKWNVFLKVDCGYHRCGVIPEDPKSLELVEKINQSKFVNFLGIYSHSGHSYATNSIQQTQEIAEQERSISSGFAKAIEEKGIKCPVVSVGATPSCSHATSWEGCTEIHPGNYIFYDRFQAHIGSCTMEDVACSVATTVIGNYPQRNQIVIDAGALALSKDTGPTQGKDWGVIRGHPYLKIVSLSQEVAIVELDKDESKMKIEDFPIGRLLYIIPNHSCLTAALYATHIIEERGNFFSVWETSKRVADFPLTWNL